ncbi:ZIP family metal transporter [Candidatus Peregrinibacteria bacterium CG10_big_fil_rev_8_21_14_0_10_49_24]|nr:MAG: ZIP family metal transporter [Candidatus Peregrinibacteria bacterium CG11_big_fil_rev_8_21_14_0_20_49_14]PIR51280.1 MAG: ZIP family metal transporter [Candidatus Peregrinibacteria bacterium CG10_big_fil_rev_8_21_14_0_10_49_24]PJA68088.1 MAG: ZIP family metal transporter [Candidatus Peregrinibacteria bacterium CG_4_9_14_3_um_filter_49_12]
MEHPTLLIFLSIFGVSLVSLVGVSLLSVQHAVLERMLLHFVSFSTGAFLGNVFIHLLPEVMERSADAHEALLIVLGGIVLSFIVEKFIHWRHCHSLECEGHVHVAGKMVLFGDAVHNILDGILIATAYLASIPLGIATTMAVFLHEVPQEIGDFAVLLHSGYSRKKALFYNFLSALTALLGGASVLFLSAQVDHIEKILLPIAAGNFLYIAGSDLIPELHKEARPRQAVVQLIFMLAGIGLMYLLSQAAEVH